MTFTQEYLRVAKAAGRKPEVHNVQFRRLTPPTLEQMSIYLFSNLYKETRPKNPSKQKAEGEVKSYSCNLCKDIQNVNASSEMFPKHLENFHLIPNLFPLDYSHSMFVAKGEHPTDEWYLLPSFEQLKEIVQFTHDKQTISWRNVNGTNSSIREHEHTHTFKIGAAPIEYLAEQRVEVAEGIATLPNYFGQTLVFSGESRVKAAYELLTELTKQEHPNAEMAAKKHFPFGLLVSQDKIYVTPFRYPQNFERGAIGAGEVFGIYSVPAKVKIEEAGVTDDIWNGYLEDQRRDAVLNVMSRITYDEVAGKIESVLFPHKYSDLQLTDLVRA